MLTTLREPHKNVMDLFIFCTNIRRRSDFNHLCLELKRMPGVSDCTIDLDDCDKVLRVECSNISMEKIIRIVRRSGFQCEEMED